MSASVANDFGRPGNRLASAGTSRASSEPCASTCATQLVFGRVRHVMTERLGEELVGRGEIFFAVPEQHARAGVERGARRFGDKCRLAEAGFTRDEQHFASIAGRDALATRPPSS